MDKKINTARLSVISNSVLIVLKLLAGSLSGSVSIISEAIHSFLDLLASIIAYFAVKLSRKRPDKNHPYGHGKVENVSGIIEALLILIAAIWIIYEAIDKINVENKVEYYWLGIIIMLISAVVNFFVSRRLYKVAKETDSIALEADALHLKTDVYTSLGVAIALIFIWFTGFQLLDPIIAIIIALIILKEVFVLIKNAYTPLIDTTLPDDEIKIIKNSIKVHYKPNMIISNLRTRKSGSDRYIDITLQLPGSLSVTESHELCDLIEDEIKNNLTLAEVNIHIEPIEINNDKRSRIY